MSTSPIPCHVFTLEWVSEQRRKYNHHPDHARPRLYHFWTSDECRSHREIVERWVDLLPPESRQRVASRLRTPEQFEQTNNELAVGDSLRRMGYAVEYEAEMGGLTPDWLARRHSGEPAFILEVFSSMPPEVRQRHDDSWDLLRRRLQGLPGDAFLTIQPPFLDGDEEPVAPPPGARQKQIARAVEQWLESDPLEGEGLSVDGFVIRFLGRSPSLDHISCGMSCLPFWVDGDPLREAVGEKAAKYRQLSEDARLPFVVCVVPTFDSGRGLQELRDAVLGAERCRLVRDQLGSYREEPYRDTDGLFAKYPTLSAVTLGVWHERKVAHAVLQNPSATYPLAKDAFPSDQSATTDS